MPGAEPRPGLRRRLGAGQLVAEAAQGRDRQDRRLELVGAALAALEVGEGRRGAGDDLAVVDEVEQRRTMAGARPSELDHEALTSTSSAGQVGAAEAAVALEVDAQAAERVVEPRLHGAQLDSEHLGRLLERQPVEVVEDDDALVLLRQRGDALADDLAELRLLGPLGGQRPVVGDGVLGGLVDRARVEPAA